MCYLVTGAWVGSFILVGRFMFETPGEDLELPSYVKKPELVREE